MNPTLRALARPLLLGAALVAGTLHAEPTPHPTREGRLVATIGDVEIEYSPGHEPYVQPFAEAMSAWRKEQLAKRALVAPAVLSPEDMRTRRDEILLQVAHAIGLEKPTPIQGPVYDTFLNYYALVLTLHQITSAGQEHFAAARRFALWERADLAGRLARGDSIEGFKRDATTGKIEFQFEAELPPAETTANGEQRALEEIATRGIDRSFNYTVKDGVAHFSADVKIQLGNLAKSPALFLAHQTAEKFRTHLASIDPVMPVKLEDENGALLPPADAIARHIRFMKEFASGAAQSSASAMCDGPLVLLVLHETTEAGLVEHYIGSADRRWLCDGTANYVSWKIARDSAGSEFAQQVYDLSEQLARFATLQPQIQLAQWRAVEAQAEKDRKSELDDAHYAFATRALFLMSERHGEDLLPQLWQEIGRTPRAKVSMKTTEKAFRKLTDARLNRLVRDAEKLPLPVTTPSITRP